MQTEINFNKNGKEKFSFHNTISESKDLPKFERKAYTQEQVILAHFVSTGVKHTALECADTLHIHESSARRSVTNLFKRGFLRKTDQQKVERYGKKNYFYELVNAKGNENKKTS